MVCHNGLSVSDCVIHSRSLYNSVRNKSKTALHREVIYSCAHAVNPFTFFVSEYYVLCASVYIPVIFNLFALSSVALFFFSLLGFC